jgi:hypothetical protein
MRRLWLPAACALLVADLALANWGFHAAVDPALLDLQAGDGAVAAAAAGPLAAHQL